jgi:hypothetical protein
VSKETCKETCYRAKETTTILPRAYLRIALVPSGTRNCCEGTTHNAAKITNTGRVDPQRPPPARVLAIAEGVQFLSEIHEHERNGGPAVRTASSLSIRCCSAPRHTRLSRKREVGYNRFQREEKRVRAPWHPVHACSHAVTCPLTSLLGKSKCKSRARSLAHSLTHTAPSHHKPAHLSLLHSYKPFHYGCQTRAWKAGHKCECATAARTGTRSEADS